ncbi:MAG: tRNA-dihydrouridine synthase family protein [Chthonomonas sp.]|nr:tRNA-dihydrouridine synthase family protein [Chthonomonas sp.]
MIEFGRPALVFAPMDGVTDAAMREHVGSWRAFSYSVTEFLRVSQVPLPAKVFTREVPELANGAKTRQGLPVQVQLLGGDPERMALSAMAAVRAGAQSIDLNFGCPAPTVNRNDGGASLLRCPDRIEQIVRAVRQAVPLSIPVSAKLRLGWEDIDDVHENAARAVAGGANWLTLHARTRMQGYQPPVFWPKVGDVLRAVSVPVIANGDIWTLDDFRRCRDETGCEHFMIGRGALARPNLAGVIAHELGLRKDKPGEINWHEEFCAFLACEAQVPMSNPRKALLRLKQWANIAHKFGEFPCFDAIKTANSQEELLAALDRHDVGRK